MKLRQRVLLSLLAGALALAVLVWWRHFFLVHALITSVAVGGLVFAVLHSAERMRQTYW